MGVVAGAAVGAAVGATVGAAVGAGVGVVVGPARKRRGAEREDGGTETDGCQSKAQHVELMSSLDEGL